MHLARRAPALEGAGGWPVRNRVWLESFNPASDRGNRTAQQRVVQDACGFGMAWHQALRSGVPATPRDVGNCTPGALWMCECARA